MSSAAHGDSGYDAAFYRYIGAGSLRSAEIVVGTLVEMLGDAPHGVLDVGCGTGAWLLPWKRRGAEVTGIEGSAAAAGAALLDPAEMRVHDLCTALDLERRFDLVQCLEVAEHLPEQHAPTLVASLCRHADLVLFSAAPPGQGGENHINERPYGYWQALFAEQGYDMYDPLRGRILRDARIKPWYRYNTFVYLREGAAPVLASRLDGFRVPAGTGVRDLSPLSYRLRKRLVSALPVALSTLLARGKKRLFNLLGTS